MFPKNCLYCCAVSWLLLTSLAWSRTWTSSAGKEIEADFVDADEQTVTLRKSDGKEIKFKIDLLSDPDQQLIRNILMRRVGKDSNTSVTAKPAASKLPITKEPEVAAESSAPTEKKLFGELTPVTKAAKGLSAEEKTPKAVEKEKPKGMKTVDRKWTNNQGKTISGRFIKMQGNNAMIFVTNRQIPAPFDQLSLTDQQYIAEVLASRGEKIDLPNAPPNANAVATNNQPVTNPNPEAALPTPVPVPGVTPDATSLAAGVPPELIKAYGGFTLRDGTPITPAMIAELTPDQQNNLRSYLNYPDQGRQEMAQIVIGTAIEQKKRLNPNPMSLSNNPSPTTNPEITAQTGNNPPSMPKSGKVGIPNVNALAALAETPPETTATPTTITPPPASPASQPTPIPQPNTTTPAQVAPTQMAAIPAPTTTTYPSASPAHVYTDAERREDAKIDAIFAKAAFKSRMRTIAGIVWTVIAAVVAGVVFLVKKMRGQPEATS